jgi:hypothetical protein
MKRDEGQRLRFDVPIESEDDLAALEGASWPLARPSSRRSAAAPTACRLVTAATRPAKR